MEDIVTDMDGSLGSNDLNETMYSNLSWTNGTMYEDEEPLYDPPIGITIVLSLFYGLISLVSVLGNSTVIFIVVTSRRMQSVTNFFIANLALADVIIGLFSIPFAFQAALLQRWNLPGFMCPFSPFFENVSVNTSVLTLTAIALDRYRAIVYPLKSHASKLKTKGIILGIWLISILLSIPQAVSFRTYTIVEVGNVMVLQCLPNNMDRTIFQYYTNLLVLVQYVIPLVLISAAYIRMAVVLWGSRTPGAAQIERDKTVNNNKKKVIKMLMVVVVLFTLSWLPFKFYIVLQFVFPNINYYPYINVIWFCCHWLAMSNSCYNPFIYFLCNDKFKKEARLRFSKCFCCGHKPAQEQVLFRSGDTFYHRNRANQSTLNSTFASKTTRIPAVASTRNARNVNNHNNRNGNNHNNFNRTDTFNYNNTVDSFCADNEVAICLDIENNQYNSKNVTFTEETNNFINKESNDFINQESNNFVVSNGHNKDERL